MTTNPTNASGDDGSLQSGLQGLTPGEKSGAAAGPADGTFRLDALSAQGAEASAPTGRKALPMQGVFFGIMVLAVGAALLVMRQLGLGPTLSFAGITSDYTPPAKKQDHSKILEDLSSIQVESQVPADQVQKNPFKISDSIPTNIATAPTGDPEADARRAAELAQREAESKMARVQSALASLEIHGILGGSNPLARVNDETVRVGDTLAEIFTVTAITTRAIELEYEGQAFTVSMDDQKSSAKKSTGPAAPKGSKRK